ncbi:MAG: tail fiber protein [Caulobacteraceae bacterium]|nr:tail fiber protein [Caulobacteraceae bacterium]
MTISTYTNGNFTNVSFGTATGNHTVSTTATITTGTIPRLTAGTTTGTAAVFTSSTLTTAIIPSGTFGTTTSTAATITNLTTTLTGDFTISNGTATLGTTGVTEGTYGTSTIIPRFSVDTKGRIKTVSTTAVDSVKAGTIIAWSTGTAPSGYLHCDGSGISRTTYSDLFSVIGTSYGTGNGSSTFNIPDLRGIFIRGIDSQSIGGITYSGTIGTKSGDTMQGHFHSLANGTLVWRSVSGAYSFSGGVSHAAQTLSVGAATTDGTNGTPRIGSETAPANIALMYCIKF